MKWKKLGKIFEISNYSNEATHSSNPTAIVFENFIRVFFSTRIENKSNISFFDFDIDQHKVISISRIPLINHGEKNACDESGLGLGYATRDKFDKYCFLSMGWQSPKSSHWRGDIVETVFKSGIYFTKPLKIINDPFGISYSYPTIIQKNKQDYRMYYGSTESWDAGNGEMSHLICQAQSSDLVEWKYINQPIKSIFGQAQAFSRPTVISFDGIYHMWFSYRGNSDKYKIGYAKSNDLDVWQTIFDSNFVIDYSDAGWDSEMVCYPNVFEYRRKLFMLYNGNEYGKTGIGLAVLE